MQTFLPYPDFVESAKSLDNKRLGKQRIEVLQIYNALQENGYKLCPFCSGKGYFFTDDYIECSKCKSTGKIRRGWYNHPITKMWQGYENSLLHYGIVMCNEWINRGYKDTLKDKFLCILSDDYYENPLWLGNDTFHASHRSNLLRKNKEWYSQFGWKESDDLPYVWIIKE